MIEWFRRLSQQDVIATIYGERPSLVLECLSLIRRAGRYDPDSSQASLLLISARISRRLDWMVATGSQPLYAVMHSVQLTFMARR
jgi:hypothetical protein